MGGEGRGEDNRGGGREGRGKKGGKGRGREMPPLTQIPGSAPGYIDSHNLLEQSRC